jgi:hypothetical protein
LHGEVGLRSQVTHGGTRAHFRGGVRSRAVGRVVALEPSRAGRQSLELWDTRQRQSSPKWGGLVRWCGTRGCTPHPLSRLEAYTRGYSVCRVPTHFLLVMANRDKLRSPDEFDKYISAEIPDKDKFPMLHDLVWKHMMHGPCDVLNDKCKCMQDGEYRFWFPPQFCDATQMGKDSYPVYRRRDDEQVVEVRNAKLDNKWVIPFNPSLLMLYNCHINIEMCSSIKTVKYLHKYIYKGPDGASYCVDKSDNGDKVVTNEIKQFRDARCVTPLEAAYQLYGFSLYQMYPPVLQLVVYLPGMHMATYNERDNMHNVINCEQS